MSVSRALSTVVLASALALGGAVPAHAIADGRNVSAGVLSSSLVRLQIGEIACTGTLITPSWVLTARHCISEGGKAGAAVGASVHNQFSEILQAIIHPTADLALVQLAAPSNAGTANISGSHLQPNQMANVTGWGGYNSRGQQWGQQADAQVQRRISNLPGPDRTAVMLETVISNGRLLPGDSGGPLFINGEIAGVLSMSTAETANPSNDGTVGWYVPLAEHADWIARHTGKNVPVAAGTPAPLVDADRYPTYIPAPQIQNIPSTGSSTIDSTLRSWALGAF